MIYVLIMSAIFSGGMRTASVLHSQHDYPSYDACQRAYGIARDQMLAMNADKVQGTCMQETSNDTRNK